MQINSMKYLFYLIDLPSTFVFQERLIPIDF